MPNEMIWSSNGLSFVLFLDAIMKILRAGGNVLLPIDTAGRALELILHLDQVHLI